MAPHATEGPCATDRDAALSGTKAQGAAQSSQGGTQSSRLFDLEEKRSTAELERLINQTTTPQSCPLAAIIERNIPIYGCTTLDITTPASRDHLMQEWYNVLLHGPGVLVLKNMYTEPTVLPSANEAFSAIITQESSTAKKGDHFSPSTTNSRIWNSFSKHCLSNPHSFLQYYSNPFLSLIAESYLGPGYRITAQVNVVHPGGAPQTVHRDYHLGFQAPEKVVRWPRAMHVASQLLTLQGAVAQTDMPLDSGPTRLLPFSQGLEDGFVAYRRKEFQEVFAERWVSLPLKKGDGLFFNPALFHAAGENVTEDVVRSANLLQISSAYGKPMEMIDSLPLVERTWDFLREKYGKEGESDGVLSFIKAVGEGYPFPTNLDRRPPAPGGMAPESEQDILLRGLEQGWNTSRIVEELSTMREASKA